ncbi:MAG: hypothetical protein CMI63_21550 [Parvularcula sp.]|nr:hypothetical protein [Parvularcula sp.]
MRAQHKQHNKRNIQNFALPAAGFLVVSGVTSVCAADEADEIVVTAQKREQALSDVPIAISALSRDDLEKRNYTGLEELTGAVPNLSISNYGGSLRANIRGVGQPSLNPGAEGATAMHLNGVFLSRTYEGGLTFADLDRIEILRGPQGTLYGRNATGGSINFISKRPSEEFEASFKATYGNYELIRTEGMVSGALTDRLLGRLVVGSENRRGYSLNLFDGEYYDDSNKRSARGTLLFNASDKMTFTLVADYHYENDGNYATHLMGEGVAGQTLAGVLAGGETTPLDANGSAIDARVLNIDSIPENKRHVGGVSLNAEWQLSDALKLVSISGYRRSKYRFTADFDATTTPFPSNEPDYNYVQGESAEQYSEELQLIGEHSRLNWILGGYYFHEGLSPAFYDFGFSPPPFVFGLRASGDTETNAYAFFGQATYAATDRLDLTVGLRYSNEKRSINEQWTSGGAVLGFFGPCLEQPDFLCINENSERFDSLTPKFVVDYDLTDELMIYASAGRGFKSGGFSVGDLQPAFTPELIWAYEGGVKFNDDSGRLLVNLSGFHYKYTDLQIVQVIDGFTSTKNAASSTVNGFEAEIVAQPFDGLSLTNAFAFLDAQFDEFMIADPAFPALGIQDLSGNYLPNSPKFTNNISVNFETPVFTDKLLRATFEWSWRDTTYFTEFNLPNASQPSVSMLNSSLAISGGEDARWFLEVWGKNLTDELVISQNFISSDTLGRPRNGSLLPPRTYGVTLGVEF